MSASISEAGSVRAGRPGISGCPGSRSQIPMISREEAIFGHFLTLKFRANSYYASICACYYPMTLIPVGKSMAKDRLSGKLAVILHADIAGSTALMRHDEQLAHERIQDCFHRFNDTVIRYHGHVCELRGDALLAEFHRASDAVTAALAFQSEQHDIYKISKTIFNPRSGLELPWVKW